MIKQKLNADYIKNSLNPFDFYRYELSNAKLKKPDWNDGGLCPFHADTTTGSFRVNVDTGSYCCFACGTKGSDVISFTMALNGINFIDALAKLADEWGIV